MKFYEILDVPPDATDEQIKAAYRILVQLHHPDRLQQVNPAVRAYAEERLKKINEAYRELSDPERRSRYDATWQAARARPAAAPEWEGYAPSPDDPVWEWSKKEARRKGRAAEEAEEAYDAWAHEEATRYAEQREAERARRAQEEVRTAEARAKQAAEQQFPRARLHGNALVVHFASGVWTTLVHVPAGPFRMGSNAAEDAEAGKAEQPAHSVRLSDYYLGKYPVTNAQYAAFLRATGRAVALPSGVLPVVNVTWDDAAAFCRWVSVATARPFRLPTEAEWEKAARGPEGLRYPWGEAWDPTRLNSNNIVGGLTPVDRYSPDSDGPYGTADQLGNVWEWCSDWFDPQLYARRAARGNASDPVGPPTGQGYVVRGGAFDSPPRHTRSAHRNWYYPDTTRANLGFRLAAGGG